MWTTHRNWFSLLSYFPKYLKLKLCQFLLRDATCKHPTKVEIWSFTTKHLITASTVVVSLTSSKQFSSFNNWVKCRIQNLLSWMLNLYNTIINSTKQNPNEKVTCVYVRQVYSFMCEKEQSQIWGNKLFWVVHIYFPFVSWQPKINHRKCNSLHSKRPKSQKHQNQSLSAWEYRTASPQL